MSNSLIRKWLVFEILILFVGSSFISTIGGLAVEKESNLPIFNGNTLFVGGTGEGNYSTIQDAIDNASDGDTIFVYNGTYYENPVIGKSIDLIGESKENTIINSSSKFSNVVTINKDWVNISEFTIENCEGIEVAGMKVGADYCLIKEIIFRNNEPYGLSLNPSDYTTIIDSKFLENRIGIYTKFSDYNTISNNIVSDNEQYGIVCAFSSNNNIIDNKASSNGIIGLITNNCNYFYISNNTAISNEQNGMYILDSNNIKVFKNNILNNNYYGILCENSNNNIIFHNNFVENNQNAKDDSTNTWYNSTLQEGNYWDDYTGEDSAGDGIGDTPYNIPGNGNQDNYPLMTPYGPPHADFTYIVDGKKVTFNASRSYDYDGIIISYDWDFGDTNNGSGSPVDHIYSEDGTYNVTLNITDNDGKTDFIIRTILVDSSPPEIIDHSNSTATTGDIYIFNATVTDNIEVYEVLAGYQYGDGDMLHINMYKTTDDYWEGNITIDDTLDFINYSIYAVDTFGNGNCSESKTITIYDNDPPEITNVIADPWVQMSGSNVNVSAVVTENIKISDVNLHIVYPDSTIQNFSIINNKIGDTYYSEKIYTIPGNYTFHIWAKDTSNNANISEDQKFKIAQGTKPSSPEITGPRTGKPDNLLTFTFKSFDSEGHKIYYIIDWGDDKIEEIGPFDSGQEATATHSWDSKSEYTIQAKAKDSVGLESDWSRHTINIPWTKHYYFKFKMLDLLGERFPNLQIIIKFILGLLQ